MHLKLNIFHVAPPATNLEEDQITSDNTMWARTSLSAFLDLIAIPFELIVVVRYTHRTCRCRSIQVYGQQAQPPCGIQTRRLPLVFLSAAFAFWLACISSRCLSTSSGGPVVQRRLASTIRSTARVFTTDGVDQNSATISHGASQKLDIFRPQRRVGRATRGGRRKLPGAHVR